MTDRQWEGLDEELKSIRPEQGELPMGPEFDEARFKRRVVREYKRRTHAETRSRWLGRGLTGLTAAAAVWAGLLIADPFTASQTEQGAGLYSQAGELQAKGETAAMESAASATANRTTDTAKRVATPQEVVKYDTTVPDLGSGQLAFYFSGQITAEQMRDLKLPPEQMLDEETEFGLYLLNGSVQAYGLADGELQVRIRQEPTRLQVWSVPSLLLKDYAGQTVRVRVFDEAGAELTPMQEIVLPGAR